MRAIVVTDQAAGTAGMKLVERPEPLGASLASLSGANYGDVVVQVHASGFTGDELSWPSTWIDRLGRDRTPSIPGHELAGVVTALSYGTTGLSVGQRVFGLTDWTDFVVVPDRAQLSELVQRVRDGRLRTNIGNVAALDDAVAAFNPIERIKGKND